MPNYSDTVHCSHCGHKGHNKATCGSLTERYKELATQYSDNLSGAHYRKTYESRSKLNLETGEPISKKKYKPTRTNKQATCSYCNYAYCDESDEAVGHTRRTCVELKEGKTWLLALNAQHRKNVYAALHRDGYGRGFLLGINEWDSGAGNYIKSAGIATKIDWNKVNVFSGENIAITVITPVHGAVEKALPYLRHPEIEGAWLKRFSSNHPDDFERMKSQSLPEESMRYDLGRWWGVSERRGAEVGTDGYDVHGNQGNSIYSASGSAWGEIPAEYVDGGGEYFKQYFGKMTAKRSRYA